MAVKISEQKLKSKAHRICRQGQTGQKKKKYKRTKKKPPLRAAFKKT